MTRRILLGIILTTALFATTGCKDSEDTTPSYADTERLESLLDRSIPDIAEFCDKYGTYILYDFDQRLDFAYQFEQATAWENATINKLQRDGAIEAMAWLKGNVFCHYNDSFKEKYLPRKFLITQTIASNEELGRSVPVNGEHSAVANINSISVGKYINSQDIDRVILADYLVNARGEAPVEDAFYNVSETYYSTLMNEKRKQAKALIAENPDFFHEYGFFNPVDDESTYFPSARLDLVQYIDSLVGMTQELHDRIMGQENSDMLIKMAYVAHGLKSIGVEVDRLNPYAVDFLEVNISGVNPGVKFNSIPAAFSEEEKVSFTVLRGENNLQKAEVYMHDKLVATFDLTSQSDAPSIPLEVTLTGLQPQTNVFSIWIYEEGKSRPSAKASATINYYANNNVISLSIQDDNADEFLRENYRMKVDFSDGIVSKNEEKDVITITFTHIAKLDLTTWMEYDGEKRYWRTHFAGDKVDWIEEYEEVVNYTTYTSTNVLRHSYLFTYDENGQLAKVTKKTEDKEETIVNNVSWVNGEMLAYDITTAKGTQTYSPKYSSLDHKTRIDLLDENLSGAAYQHNGDEETNPYYLPGIPAVIPGKVAGIPLQFIYSEYLFNAIDDAKGNVLWNAGWKLDKSDARNPFRGTTTQSNGHTWYYRLILKP